MTNKWTFNKTTDDAWRHDYFDTKEEAIQAGMTYAKEEDWDSLFITTQREDPHPLRWGMNRRHIPKQP